MFDQDGLLELEVGSGDPDEIALVAIDAGAADVEVDDGTVTVFTEPQDLHQVQQALTAGGFAVNEAQLSMRPKTLLEPEAAVAVKVIRLVEKLEDLDDVQEVFTNLDITDEVLAAVG